MSHVPGHVGLGDIRTAQRNLGGGGLFSPALPDPTLSRVPLTPTGEPRTVNGGGNNNNPIDRRTDAQIEADQTLALAESLVAQRPDIFINTDEALLYLSVDSTTRKALWPGFSGTTGTGGSSSPLWRPGELELLLADFGLDVDKFKEEKRQFGIEFGLSKEEFGLRERQTGETIRANKALEADRARGRGLQAASDALSAYLRASESRDKRQIGVLQSLPGLLPSLVSPDQKFFAGLEPGGILAQAARRFGLGDIGSVPIVPVTLNIGDFIAGDPEAAGTRQDLIDKILEIGGVAGNAAKAEVAATQQDAANLEGARSVPGGTVFAGGSPAQKAFEAALKGIN